MSSARVVRCSVKSGNERNPYRVLYMSRETAQHTEYKLGNSKYKFRLSASLQIVCGEEGGDDVRSAWPSDALGNTRATMDSTKGSQTVRWSQSQKAVLSSD